MTNTAGPRANPYLQFLSIGGLAATTIGIIIASVASQNADHTRSADEIAVSLAGGQFADSDLHAGMWFGIVLAILGAVMMIIWVAIKALTPQDPPVDIEPLFSKDAKVDGGPLDG